MSLFCLTTRSLHTCSFSRSVFVCAHLFYVLNISDCIIRVYKESDGIQTDAVNTNVKAVLCSGWLFLILSFLK